MECICSPEFVEQSCLQLGFYLASWGMLRRVYHPLEQECQILQTGTESIARCDARLWEIDLPYADKDIELLLRVGEDFCEALENKV